MTVRAGLLLGTIEMLEQKPIMRGIKYEHLALVIDQKKVTAIAVREGETMQHNRVVLFLYAVPLDLVRIVETSVVVSQHDEKNREMLLCGEEEFHMIKTCKS